MWHGMADMAADNGFLEEVRRQVEDEEIPARVSNKLLWGAIVVASKDRKHLWQDVRGLQRKANFWGAVAGLMGGVSALLIALATGLL